MGAPRGSRKSVRRSAPEMQVHGPQGYICVSASHLQVNPGNSQRVEVVFRHALFPEAQRGYPGKEAAPPCSAWAPRCWLLCLKTFLVLRTGSLGVLSEALHSGLDLVAAVITFLSVRVSDSPRTSATLTATANSRISPLLSRPDFSSSPLVTSSTKPFRGYSSTPCISNPASSPLSYCSWPWHRYDPRPRADRRCAKVPQ